MTLRILAALLIAVVAASLALAEVGIGDSRDSVLKLYGKPTSVVKRGDREILLYPKGGRVELVDGKVENVKGPLPAPLVDAAAPKAASIEATSEGQPAATTPASGTPAPAPATAAAGQKAAPAGAKGPASGDFSTAAAANELAKHVEKMDTAWGAAPAREEAHSPLGSVAEFLTGLVLRFGVTILALKLAFKYWEMDAFWTGILAIAGIDMALHATLELLGPATGGFTSMVAIENGIPGVVLIYTVNRFCFNKRLHNAVLTAAAVKTVVTLCYVFIGVAALNALYG